MKQFLFIVLIVALFFFGAQFYQDDAEQTTELPAVSDNIEQLIIDGCLYERSVDVSDFKLSSAELETLVVSMRAKGQLPWYTDTDCRYTYDQLGGCVKEFIPSTIYNGAIDKFLYEQKVAEILNACVFEGMSQHQIALALHDYLVLNSYYDETLTKHTGYDLLVDGTAVCSGYAAAYQDLLSRAGISSVCVISEKMNHGWNLVNIDGQWYHVDVTWDDMKPDVYGYVSHDYFLLTDDEISSGEEPHYGWSTDISCSDIRFSNAYWRGVSSQICFLDYDTCCVLRSHDYVNSIYLRCETTGKETLIYKENKTSADIGAGQYYYSHNSLSLWEDKLYFNTLDKVYSINRNGSGLQEVHTYNIEDNKKIIRGCFISNGFAYATVADHDGNLSHFSFSLTDYFHAHSYVETVYEPSCCSQGYSIFTCDCGLSFESKFVAPGKHDYKIVSGNGSDKEADGVFKGLNLVQVCSECGESSPFVLSKAVVKDWVSEHLVVIILVWVGVIGLLLLRKKK